MTVCEMLGLHSLVPARRLEFKLQEDSQLPGHFVRAHVLGRNSEYQIVTDRINGFACVRCPHFESKP